MNSEYRSWAYIILLAMFFNVTGFFPLVQAEETAWDEGMIAEIELENIPQPMEGIVWRYDVKKAFEKAEENGRPVMVVMRCLPCKQCSIFDKTVLEGGPELDPLFKQFNMVRLTSVHDLDLNLFPVNDYQDLDVSWWAWFFSPEGEIYSVFGGNDINGVENRITKPALVNTMKRVLAYHYSGAAKQDSLVKRLALMEANNTPRDLPGYTSWISKRSHEADAAGCIHCHQVREILWQPAIDDGTFNKHKDTQLWPYPENVGITVDTDHGLKVIKVEDNSPADAIGIRQGDILAAAEDTRLLSQTDFRGVLHRAPLYGDAEVEVAWLRGDEVKTGTLKLKEGWRKTNMDWRMSISQGNISTGPGFFPLQVGKGGRQKHGIAEDQMAVRPFFGENPQGPAYQAGLRGGDIIISVNGESPNVAGRAFLVWLRMNYEPGDTVRMRAISRNGKTKTAAYTLQRREVY